MPTFGVHIDRIVHRNGEAQSFSNRWAKLAEERGVSVVLLNSGHSDFYELIGQCDAFMWRFGYSSFELVFAKRVLQSIEHGMRIPVFPDSKTAWHFEDKISQHYLLLAAGIPVPRTEVLWSMQEALAYLDSARFPFVVKLSGGIQSRNVRLAKDRSEGRALINVIFNSGISSLDGWTRGIKKLLGRTVLPIGLLLGKKFPRDLQTGYLLAQEFLPGNEFDTRVTVIGESAFAFRRINRPDDFRASGSGHIDWNPESIDLAAIELAFLVSDRLQTQCVAVDVLYRNNVPVVAEISYTFASWAVRDCPGQWIRDKAGDVVSYRWSEGRRHPEDIIFENFLDEVERFYR